MSKSTLSCWKIGIKTDLFTLTENQGGNKVGGGPVLRFTEIEPVILA